MTRARIPCAVCGEPFVPMSRTHFCCSDECSAERRRLGELGKKALVNVPAMKFEEIGRELGISRARVQILYHRALRKLRAAVAQEDLR